MNEQPKFRKRPRLLKYLKGHPIRNMIALIDQIEAGHYVILRDKRMHPAVVGGMTLFILRRFVADGQFHTAIPNPYYQEEVPF